MKTRQALMQSIPDYLKRCSLLPYVGVALPAPEPELKLAVVIPSLAERKNLKPVLDSLAQGSRRLAEAEVLVVVNNAVHADPAVAEDNAGTLQDMLEVRIPGLKVFALDYASPGRALPDSKAGVGLARRVGLDAALARLWQAGNAKRSAIACLDADSPVAPGYLDALLEVFDSDDPPVAGICAYTHPEPEDRRLAESATYYELWLRYLEYGLRIARTPYAYQTVGSCLAVSALGYAQVSGMEPRQAGEDFHFLRKLIKLSGEKSLARILGARVFPRRGFRSACRSAPGGPCSAACRREPWPTRGWNRRNFFWN